MKENMGQKSWEAQGRTHYLRDQAKEKAHEVGDRVRESARDIGHKAREAADRVGQEGASMLEHQKQRAASEISNLGAAVRDAAERLHRENDHNLAGYADAMADQVERIAHYLEQARLRDLVEDIRGTARRHPVAFASGMFIAGIIAARFLKASSERSEGYGYAEFESRTPSAEPATTTPIRGGGQTVEPGGLGATGFEPTPEVSRPTSPPAEQQNIDKPEGF